MRWKEWKNLKGIGFPKFKKMVNKREMKYVKSNSINVKRGINFIS